MQFVDFQPLNIKVEGMEEIRIPKMVRIRQKYDRTRIEDLTAHILSELRALPDPEQYRGKRLCITAGSRGIPHLAEIIRTVADELKRWGAEPFVIPAMGSHGGATAEGQRDYLDYCFGINEESVGIPVLSSMEVVQIGSLPDGTPVYCDRYAYESDGIIVLNKVKPHTDFRGRIESGMCKMMAIGLAKHKGAAMFHMKGFQSFAKRIPQVAELFLQKAPVAFGIGIVENAYDEICNFEVIQKDAIIDRDMALLAIAKSKIAVFKTHDLDVLIIDEIGKNISGNGHDPNITGRNNSGGFEDALNLKKLFVRGLNEATHHNACGLAVADITTLRCVRDVDLESTWVNIYNCNMLNGGRIPMYANNDKEAILYSIRTCTGIDFADVRVARIRDTLHMEEILVSENVAGELAARDDVEILSDPFEMEFGEDGYLTD